MIYTTIMFRQNDIIMATFCNAVTTLLLLLLCIGFCVCELFMLTVEYATRIVYIRINTVHAAILYLMVIMIARSEFRLMKSRIRNFVSDYDFLRV